MDWFVFLLGGIVGAAAMGAAWAVRWANQPAPKIEFHKVEPERDGTPAGPKRRARVTDAHMSQPRDYWNGYKPRS